MLAMLKIPPDHDDFKHFRTDPPEVKLEAWKQLQRRLAMRDLAICATAIIGLVMAILLIVLKLRVV